MDEVREQMGQAMTRCYSRDDFRLREAQELASMTSPSMTDEYAYMSVEQRHAAIGVFFGYLLMAQIMMASVTEQYVAKLLRGMAEKGLIRQRMKQDVNAMRKLVEDMKNSCDGHDQSLVTEFCSTIHPALMQDYYNAGGSLTQRAQYMFGRECGQLCELLFLSAKQLADNLRKPHSELIAQAMTAYMICQTGKELYEYMRLRMERLAGGIGRFRLRNSGYNEKMRFLLERIICQLGLERDTLVTEKMGGAALREYTRRFQEVMVTRGMLNGVDGQIRELREEFISYVMARLRRQIEEKHLRVADIRLLRTRLGSKEMVGDLLKEIAKVPLPEGEDWDDFDLAEAIKAHEGEGESVMKVYRKLCLQGKVIRIQPATDEEGHEVPDKKTYCIKPALQAAQEEVDAVNRQEKRYITSDMQALASIIPEKDVVDHEAQDPQPGSQPLDTVLTTREVHTEEPSAAGILKKMVSMENMITREIQEDGIVCDLTLAQAYAAYGTKKAVDQLLAECGEAARLSRRRLKQLTAQRLRQMIEEQPGAKTA